MNYLLDACALFALIAGERGEHLVNNLLESAERKEISVCMSRINLLEVYYSQIRDLGLDRADEIVESVYASPIRVIDEMDDSVFREAARLKAGYKISLADAVALAYAIRLDCTIVTADHHELDIVEQKEAVRFLWIR